MIILYALMVSKDAFFFAPAYPTEHVFDPTGAGDSFAGGFVGYLAVAKTCSVHFLHGFVQQARKGGVEVDKAAASIESNLAQRVLVHALNNLIIEFIVHSKTTNTKRIGFIAQRSRELGGNT